ncbi:MAG: patatin-like phospholipase family protein [Limnohabitans sp.]|nr:patatin-like phospholipase family protein [Limnohabitans sp.]
MRALRLYAGPKALAHLRAQGLRPEDVRVIPGAAGGPKGLVLGPLDRFLFGRWLPQSHHPVDLVGASIGAWRMATACLPDPVARSRALEHDYIHQHYVPEPGRSRPSAAQVSASFGQSLSEFFGTAVDTLLQHPRYRLHVMTSHGRGVLGREHPWATPLGYGWAYCTNLVSRRAMGHVLERVVFSSLGADGQPVPLPFATQDYPTVQQTLTPANFGPAVQASCSIPFVLQAVHDIPGAAPGAYWDGGITDYHLHLDYRATPGLVLYPHFQKAVVPGWLDKALRWRHGATAHLESTLVLAPDPEWVRQCLPNGKLPDRTDFVHYGEDLAARVRVWQRAVAESERLADEWARWLDQPDESWLEPL